MCCCKEVVVVNSDFLTKFDCIHLHGLALFSLPNLQWHLLGREVANSAVMVVVPGLVDDRPVMVGI